MSESTLSYGLPQAQDGLSLGHSPPLADWSQPADTPCADVTWEGL